MALVAKDFQTQTQWALVAIPAPIYFGQQSCTGQYAPRPRSTAGIVLAIKLISCSKDLRLK